MKLTLRALLPVLAVASVLLNSCKENTNSVSTTVPVSAHITGTVINSSSAPLSQATVTVSGVAVPYITGNDGRFLFAITIPDPSAGLNVTLSVTKSGYISSTPVTYNVKGDQDFTIQLALDLSTYAVLSGRVLDSATAFPRVGASVLVSLPGVADSTSTDDRGFFTLNVDLRGLDSLSATVTVSEPGFKSYQNKKRMLKKGANPFGSILLNIDKASTVGHVYGVVTNSVTNQLLAGVKVNLVSGVGVDSLVTVGGNYSFNLDLLGTASTSGKLYFSSGGYSDTSIDFSVNAGNTFGQNVALNPKSSVVGGGGGTTYANTIAFIEGSATQLSVYGVGGTETALLTYEVRDSLGMPVDINHQDIISLSLSGAPAAGGAFVSPSSVTSDASGRVTFTVNSGTISGALQIVAKVKRHSAVPDTIRSSPVKIIVSGGLPNQANFTIFASRINIPGENPRQNGNTSTITAMVGDKYGNPVPVGTAVYFSTDIGLVTTGTGYTDESGFASVILFSGNPRDTSNNGFGHVTASTVGQAGAAVKDSVKILFSGTPTIAHFSQTGGTAPFTISFNAYDFEHNNPLAEGTTVTVIISGTGAAVASPGSYTIPDVYAGNSFFTFDIAPISPPTSGPFTGTIIVSGPNGTVTTSFSGVAP